MAPKKHLSANWIATRLFIILGASLLVVSAFYVSSFLAILSLGLIFWGLIMLYITPSKHVPLILLNASTNSTSANIERILKEAHSTEKGIYLPPKNLKSFNSSLIFVPKINCHELPTINEISPEIYTNKIDGVFVTPPGQTLCQVFEKALGSTFLKYDIEKFEIAIPKVIVENLELASNVEFELAEKTLTVKVEGNVLTGICKDTESYPLTHKQIGCLLSSALACCLAKSTGKLTTINSEETTSNSITIEFGLEDEFVPPITKILKPSKQAVKTTTSVVHEDEKLPEELEKMVSDYESLQVQIATIDKEEETLSADYSEIEKRLEALKREKQKQN